VIELVFTPSPDEVARGRRAVRRPALVGALILLSAALAMALASGALLARDRLWLGVGLGSVGVVTLPLAGAAVAAAVRRIRDRGGRRGVPHRLRLADGRLTIETGGGARSWALGEVAVAARRDDVVVLVGPEGLPVVVPRSRVPEPALTALLGALTPAPPRLASRTSARADDPFAPPSSS
jgi:hypothetical protein